LEARGSGTHVDRDELPRQLNEPAARWRNANSWGSVTGILPALQPEAFLDKPPTEARRSVATFSVFRAALTVCPRWKTPRFIGAIRRLAGTGQYPTSACTAHSSNSVPTRAE